MKPINKTIFIFGIVFVIFILGIGYAAISTNLILGSNIDGETQEEVFITDFSGNTDEGKVNSKSFISTLLTSNISLNDTSSTITYTVQIYNNADEPYCYIGTKYGTEIGYDNPNIKFALSIEEGDWVKETDTTSYSNSTSVICSKSYKTFDITFRHTGTGTNLDLSSVLKFLFIPLKDAQVVSLIYDEKTYRDCFPKTETVATFTELDFITSVTNNNVARCNRNSTPEYIEGKISVTGVYSEYYTNDASVTVNNSDNGVKCKVYDSLSASFQDTEYESSSFTVNNFLVLNDIDDGGTPTTVMNNKEWNIDLNNKTVNFSNDKLISLTNTTVMNIVNSGTINFGESSVLGEVNSDSSLLTLSGVTIICDSTKPTIHVKKGRVEADSAEIINTGNVIAFGLTSVEENNLSGASAAGNAYYAHFEAFESVITSTGANAVYSTSRQNILCNLVKCDITGYNAAVLCDNGVGTSEPNIKVWENIRIYITGGSVRGTTQDFYTHGSRVFYTISVAFSDGLTISGTNAIKNAGVNNYVVKNYTGSTELDWYHIKDYEKKYLTTDTGEKIRVGDKVRIVNKYYSGYSLCVPAGNYVREGDVLLHTTEASWESQMWMFIRGAGNRVHIVPYQKPIYFVYIHYQTLFVDLRELEVYTPNLNKYWHEYGGGKYDVKYQSSYNAYTFVCMDDAPQGSDNLLVLCGGDVTSTNYRDVIPGYEYNTTNTKNMWIIKKG